MENLCISLLLTNVFLKTPFFGSKFFLLYTVMITNPVDAIFRNVLHTEGVTTYPKVLWMYDLWHSLLKLNLTSRH